MTSAIIVAAGQGKRMGPGINKLFLEIAGRPVVAHTWARFNDAACIDQIILVVRDALRPAFAQLADQFQFGKPYRLVVGGKERMDSVWNGLQALAPATDIVAIQDGARPGTSERLIADTIKAARETGAAVAAQRVTDTIKESDDGTLIGRTLDRARLWAVQTPQGFRRSVLVAAHAAAADEHTDDAGMVEKLGLPVHTVPGHEAAFKITKPLDLVLAEALIGTGTIPE